MTDIEYDVLYEYVLGDYDECRKMLTEEINKLVLNN